MTNRQKARLTAIRSYLSDLYRQAEEELRNRLPGSTMFSRVPVPVSFVVRQQTLSVLTDTTTTVLVMKLPDHRFVFRVYDRERKGWTSAKWRHLLPEAPTV